MRRRTATYPRALRVNQVLRQVVADELERLADADERRMVTVTAVDTAPDLRTAIVYVATLDRDASEALEERRGHLQRLIGSQTTMKRTPRLTFQADPAIAAGSRVEELLRGLQTRSGPAGRRREARGASPGRAVTVNGLAVVDKEAGWTSHDVVARCRRIFGQRRVGHAGTLDPDATGILLVGPGPRHAAPALPDRAPQDLRDRHRARARPRPPSTPRAR